MESTVKVKCSHPSCRPGSMTCSFGVIEFDENGESEITKAEADVIRDVSNLKFSDSKKESALADNEEVETIEPIVENKVLASDTMPAGLVSPLPVEQKIDSNEENPTEDSVSPEGEVPALEGDLSKLSKEDLREVCKAGELPAAKYSSLNKKELIKLIEDEKLM